MTGSLQFERRARTATMSNRWILQGGLTTRLRHAYAVLTPNRDPGPEFTRKLKSTLRIQFAGHTTVQVINSQTLASTTALAGSFGHAAAAAATAGTGLLGTQPPPTTTATTTAYDAYGNNVAPELLTTPYETQHFAYAKLCF